MALAMVADDFSRRSTRLSNRSLPVPKDRLSRFSLSTLVVRQDSTSTSSDASPGASCGPKDTTGICERPITSSSNTVPIVLGVVIPLGLAFIVLIFLHRRHVKRLRREDAEDKTKSWDWGMDGVPVSEKRRRGKNGGGSKKPEAMVLDPALRGNHDRGGISMDMGLSSPYLLPPELHQSRESLHSLSRSMTVGDDKYRATDFIPDDGSIRSPSSMKSHWDNASTYTGSSRPRMGSESSKPLIRVPTQTEVPVPTIRKPLPVAKDANSGLLAPATDDPARDSYVSTNSSNGNAAAFRASNNYLGSYISGGKQQEAATEPKDPAPQVAELDSTSDLEKPQPALLKGQPEPSTSVVPDTAGFNFGIPNNVQELPARHSTLSSTHELPSHRDSTLPQFSVTSPDNTDVEHHQPGTKRESSVYEENFASFSNHPNAYTWGASKGQLSPRDGAFPQEHAASPEPVAEKERAAHRPEATRNSQLHADHADEHEDFFDEYEEPSHKRYTGRTHSQSQSQHQNLHPRDRHSGTSTQRTSRRQSSTRESQADYYDEGEGFDFAEYEDVLGYDPRLLTMGMRPLPPDDPTENPEERANRIRSFYKEYFDEVTKPGGGNRMSYFDGTENYYDDYYGTAHSSPRGSRGHPMRPATQQQRHRAMSNGSHGPRAFSSASGRYGRPPYRPRAKLPPPKALNLLPTPYKLKDDSMLPNPMDYAPPQIFKNQRSGTPESMRGGLRPYSPSTRAFNPLVSSFDDLSALPSPHALRKSSTFTSLDFAPPRFQAKETASETGSIRSNRSGVSAFQQHNIRNGAYRISRIPREVAGTKDELASALRPQWNMNR